MKTIVVLLSKTYFPQHPKAGKHTDFKEKVMCGQCGCKLIDECVECLIGMNEAKIHTCRINFEYWKAKIDKLKACGGVLSVRQWSGKPYRSTQEIVINIPAEIIGIQKLRMVLCKDKSLFINIDGKPFLSQLVAKNDGLTTGDFKAWFLPVFEKENTDVLEFAIIHFTKFRY